MKHKGLQPHMNHNHTRWSLIKLSIKPTTSSNKGVQSHMNKSFKQCQQQLYDLSRPIIKYLYCMVKNSKRWHWNMKDNVHHWMESFCSIIIVMTQMKTLVETAISSQISKWIYSLWFVTNIIINMWKGNTS